MSDLEIKIISAIHEANDPCLIQNHAFDHILDEDEVLKVCQENGIFGSTQVFYQGKSKCGHGYLFYYGGGEVERK